MKINTDQYTARLVNNKVQVVDVNTGEIQPQSIASQYLKQLQLNTEFLNSNHDAIHSSSFSNYYRTGKRVISKLYKKLSSVQQIKVIDWLISNMWIPSNKVKCTYTEIHNQASVGRASISSTYKLLKSLGLAKFHQGCVFINPILVMRGSDTRYTVIYNDYYHSKEDWWKDVRGNDEFTIQNK